MTQKKEKMAKMFPNLQITDVYICKYCLRTEKPRADLNKVEPLEKKDQGFSDWSPGDWVIGYFVCDICQNKIEAPFPASDLHRDCGLYCKICESFHDEVNLRDTKKHYTRLIFRTPEGYKDLGEIMKYKEEQRKKQSKTQN